MASLTAADEGLIPGRIQITEAGRPAPSLACADAHQCSFRRSNPAGGRRTSASLRASCSGYGTEHQLYQAIWTASSPQQPASTSSGLALGNTVSCWRESAALSELTTADHQAGDRARTSLFAGSEAHFSQAVHQHRHPGRRPGWRARARTSTAGEARFWIRRGTARAAVQRDLALTWAKQTRYPAGGCAGT